MPISRELLDILVCPQCKDDVKLAEEGDRLICRRCKLSYLIKDGIPVMLLDEAIPLRQNKEKLKTGLRVPNELP